MPVSESTKLGLGILGAAAVAGVAGDVLLRATPWGLNVFLFVAVCVVLAVAIALWQRIELRGEGRWLALSLVFFAALFLWRDSTTLAAINGLAALISLSIAALRSRSGRIMVAGITEYFFWGFQAMMYAYAGALPTALKDVRWRELGGRGYAPAFAVARGLLISVVPLLVFGALFMAADAIFENIVSNVFDFDIAEVLGHVFLFAVIAWVMCGLLRIALVGGEIPGLTGEHPSFLSLGIVEIGVALGLMNVLFLSFVIVQVRYLFAGHALASLDLTYAEYARRGFFELVTVAALVLPLLLAAHWLLRTENRWQLRLFKLLSGSLVGLLFVVMISALYRMRLYTQQFGLTELRLYTTAFMIWMAAVLIWFLLTVLRDSRGRFAFGALMSGLIAIAALNLINPDALIARTNIERLEAGKRFDAYYLTTLSADAAPVIFDALPKIGEKCVNDSTLRESVTTRWANYRGDWRTWNLSRARARTLADEAGYETATLQPVNNMQRFETRNL